MAFKTMQSLDADTTVSLGGYNKKLKKENPTSAEGYYLGSRQVDSKLSSTGKASLHFLQTPKGNLGVWGKTDMDRKLSSVPAGSMIRITHTGTQPTPKGEMHKYKVEVDADNTIEVDLEQPKPPKTMASDDDFSAGQANDEDDEEENDDNEAADDFVSTAAPAGGLSASERAAKVQALLNKGKGAKRA